MFPGNAPKTVLITGCSSGIGKAAAAYLREKGWRVFATARRAADVEALAQEGFEACVLDVCDRATMEAAREFVLGKTGGQLTALVNNAGYGQPGPVEVLTRDQLRAQFETNVFGLVELTNLFVPLLRRQGYGRIVNISSVAGLMAAPYSGAYCASKFALEALSDALRVELRGTGVEVVLVEPGPIETEFNVKLRRLIRTQQIERAEELAGLSEHRDRKKLPFTQKADSAARVIFRALEAARPRRRYLVTKIAIVIALIAYTFPACLKDLILASRLYQKKTPPPREF